ncbi:MAG TPA: OmpA family protein [Asticcacaulis sp.]|nr:OmpA family protein [Asticcacaulis sp.]
MKAGAIACLGIAATAALAVVATTQVLPQMQTDLQTAVNRALADNGLTHVKAEVSGQDVTLRLKDNDPAHVAELTQAKTVVSGVAMPGEPHIAHGGALLNRPVSRVAIADVATPPVPADNDHSALPASQAVAMPAPPPVNGALATAVAAAVDTPSVAGDAAYEAATVAANSCEQRVNAVMAGQRLDFEPGTYDLTSPSRDVLNDVYRVVAACPATARLTVSGYTDNVGDGTVNQLISQARAQAVADALVKKGLPADRIAVRGYGAALPVADNATPEGREKNRRIVFSVNAG